MQQRNKTIRAVIAMAIGMLIGGLFIWKIGPKSIPVKKSNIDTVPKAKKSDTVFVKLLNGYPLLQENKNSPVKQTADTSLKKADDVTNKLSDNKTGAENMEIKKLARNT